jgi:hypothetical protein
LPEACKVRGELLKDRGVCLVQVLPAVDGDPIAVRERAGCP